LVKFLNSGKYCITLDFNYNEVQTQYNTFYDIFYAVALKNDVNFENLNFVKHGNEVFLKYKTQYLPMIDFAVSKKDISHNFMTLFNSLQNENNLTCNDDEKNVFTVGNSLSEDVFKIIVDKHYNANSTITCSFELLSFLDSKEIEKQYNVSIQQKITGASTTNQSPTIVISKNEKVLAELIFKINIKNEKTFDVWLFTLLDTLQQCIK